MYHAQKIITKPSLGQKVKRALPVLANLLPLSLLQRCSRQKVFLPFYHLINNEAPKHVQSLYAVRDEALFEADLDYLLRYFEPIALSELIAINQGRKAKPQKAVMHLSFDDGLQECSEIIAPILVRKGIPATFFINSAFLDNKALMFRYKQSLWLQGIKGQSPTFFNSYFFPELEFLGVRTEMRPESLVNRAQYGDDELLDHIGKVLSIDFEAFLQETKPYMSSEQVSVLLQQGFSIGGHSIDHPLYNKIALAEQLRQTIESQQFLESKFDLDYRVFAFPFTDDGLTKSFFSALQAQFPFDLSFGGAGLKQDVIPNNLQRFPMESDRLNSARKLINTEFLYYLLKIPFGKNRLKRAD